MSHVFKDYPELDVVKDFIINCFNENNTDTNEEMTYILQISTDRTTVSKLTSHVDECITFLANKVFALSVGHFIVEAQSSYLRT